jgi:hypothetical protein
MAMIMDHLEGKPQQQRDVTISDKRDVRDQLLKEGRRRLVAMEARRTFQVCPKDLRAALRQAAGAEN